MYRKGNSFRPAFTICKFKYKEVTGVGAIYGCECPYGTIRTLFITSYEMLEISNVNEVSNLLLVFEDKTIGNLYITPDWVKWLFTSPADNVTVIEFSLTALSILSRMRYERLAPADPILNEVVSVFQYSCEGSLIIGKGRVKKVFGKFIEYTNMSQRTTERSLGNEEYCCGFPLLNEQLKVVGIHTNKVGEGETLKAITIKSILEAFETFITEKLGGRTENELWLEKIAQIPKNEFHLIGSGGFGKVYKIEESNSSVTFLAVKVVSALGSLDDYKSRECTGQFR